MKSLVKPFIHDCSKFSFMQGLKAQLIAATDQIQSVKKKISQELFGDSNGEPHHFRQRRKTRVATGQAAVSEKRKLISHGIGELPKDESLDNRWRRLYRLGGYPAYHSKHRFGGGKSDSWTYAGGNLESPDAAPVRAAALEQLDICDRASLIVFPRTHQPDAVMHLAALSVSCGPINRWACNIY